MFEALYQSMTGEIKRARSEGPSSRRKRHSSSRGRK
jgi:hypothetical protein